MPTDNQAAALAAIDACIVALGVAVDDLRASLGDVAPPPVDPPAPGPSVLHQIAATLQPGEWRRVPTKLPAGASNMKAFQTVSVPEGGSADGMGWTERLIEHNGTLMVPLMRDGFGKALAVMTTAGQWSRIDSPSGWSATKAERRPFNRWFSEDGYACFAPSSADKRGMGHVVRTPLADPGSFEPHGADIGDNQMDITGNFSMCAAWGRRFAYTAGGKLRSWAAGDASWREHAAHIPQADRATGYAGTVIYNAVRDEVFAIGGQYFGAAPDTSDRALVVSSADADAKLIRAKFEDGSPLLRVTAALSRFIVHPVTGEYLLLDRDGVVYRSETGEVWRPYQDLRQIRPWGKYEAYMPWCHLSNTADVIVAVSHIEGVWLHRTLKD